MDGKSTQEESVPSKIQQDVIEILPSMAEFVDLKTRRFSTPLFPPISQILNR